MIGRYPDDRLGVIVLANTAGAPAGGIESRIAKVMLGVEDRPVVDLPAEVGLLGSLAGVYELDGERFHFTVEEGKLHVKPPQQGRDRLKFQGDLQFVSSINEQIRFTFKMTDGKATQVEIETPNDKLTASRSAENHDGKTESKSPEAK